MDRDEKMRKLLFLDVSSPSTLVTLPKGFDLEGRPICGTILYWNVEGINTQFDPTNTYIVTPLFFQIEFRQSIKAETMSNNANTEMVPVPLLRSGGWPSSSQPFPIPFDINSKVGNTFQFLLWGEGESPQPLTFTRAVFWILLDF